VALETQLIASRIDDDGRAQDGRGAWFRLDLTPSPALRHELEVVHFGRTLDFNDIGFQRRPGLNQLEWTSEYQQSDFSPTSALRGVLWHAELQFRTNEQGDRLPVVLFPEATLQYARGGSTLLSLYLESAGTDDLASRGNGRVAQPPEWSFLIEHETPRIGDLQFEFSVNPYEIILDDDGLFVGAEAAWFASDQLGFEAEASWLRSDAWVVWQRDDLFGRYARRQAEFSLDANWFPASGHELRAKLQWLAIDARDGDALRIGRGGALRPSAEDIEDFDVNTFGLQIRYRWTFAAQSDLYVVWSRGGFQERPDDPRSLGELFSDAFSLRDDDQVLVKLRYRL
jgi:hypothetical protein